MFLNELYCISCTPTRFRHNLKWDGCFWRVQLCNFTIQLGGINFSNDLRRLANFKRSVSPLFGSTCGHMKLLQSTFFKTIFRFRSKNCQKEDLSYGFQKHTLICKINVCIENFHIENNSAKDYLLYENRTSLAGVLYKHIVS